MKTLIPIYGSKHNFRHIISSLCLYIRLPLQLILDSERNDSL